VSTYFNIAPEHWLAIRLSVEVSLAATLVSLVPGTLLGIWLARTSSPLRHIADVLVLTPLVAPPVIIGFLLLLALRRLNSDLLFTFWAAALASAVVSMPLLVRTVRAAMESVDPRFSQVAATLGASWLRRLVTITIPMVWRGIVGGAVLAWARALGEFGATIVVAGNIPGRTRTIPLAVWTSLQSPTGPSIMPLVIAAILLCLIAVAVAEWLTRKLGPRQVSQ
jgi:molybdate transport system permease protein